MSVKHEEVRAVDYARDIDWEVNFDRNSGLSKPFDLWFPAIEVDWNVINIDSKSFDVPLANISIPASLGENSIRITFHDSVDHIVFDWLEKWCKSMVDRSKGVAPLESIVKTLFMRRLAPWAGDDPNNKKILDSRVYKVHPVQNINDNLTQTGKAKVFSVDFKIVGRQK